MKEALAERVLQEVVVPDLDEVDEHGALALALVRYQHSEERKFSVYHHDFSKDISGSKISELRQSV